MESHWSQEEFEETKEVIRIRYVNQRTDNTCTMAKRQITIYKTLQRKLKIEQHEHTKNWR